jgi:hypothetical protein
MRSLFSTYSKRAVQFLVSNASDFGKQIKVSFRNAGAGSSTPPHPTFCYVEERKEQRGSPKFVYRQIFYLGI